MNPMISMRLQATPDAIVAVLRGALASVKVCEQHAGW
jgi:hypothetical protein